MLGSSNIKMLLTYSCISNNIYNSLSLVLNLSTTFTTEKDNVVLLFRVF